MKHIISKNIPNQSEQMYWIDLKENPYGGIIKYYDEHLDRWVYLDEPIFQKSPANKITNDHLEALEAFVENNQSIEGLQIQIDNLNEQKADISQVYLKQEIDEAHSTITQSINKNTGNIITVNNLLSVKVEEGDAKNSNRIEEVNGALSKEINSLRNTIQKGYDDTELRNAIAEKTSYTYVEQQIQNITGVAPTVLDTLEELAKALGNDPNFATTVTDLLGTKLDRQQVIDLVTELTPTLVVETDPTVPQWAKQSTKPTYTASEVGALPSSTRIPNKTSDLTNDAGFVTRSTVTSMIQSNKPLTTEQYTKINNIDSYQILNITESDIIISELHQTIIINVPDTLSGINIKFLIESSQGCNIKLYVNSQVYTSINFYTASDEMLYTTDTSGIERFDITFIDLMNYPLTTESGENISTEGNISIVGNISDRYIIDHITAVITK